MFLKVITVVAGNLFEIAARELGDPLQWVTIAQANKLKDPFLAGRCDIGIPQANAAFIDGVGRQ